MNYWKNIMDVEVRYASIWRMRLKGFEEWDSLTALTFISEMMRDLERKLEGGQIKAFVTVADAIAVME